MCLTKITAPLHIWYHIKTKNHYNCWTFISITETHNPHARVICSFLKLRCLMQEFPIFLTKLKIPNLGKHIWHIGNLKYKFYSPGDIYLTRASPEHCLAKRPVIARNAAAPSVAANPYWNWVALSSHKVTIICCWLWEKLMGYSWWCQRSWTEMMRMNLNSTENFNIK